MLQIPAMAWLANQPYLLLSLTSLFWAGNIVLARFTGDHIPPVTMACLRWIGALVLLLPMAWPHLKRDWPVVRRHLVLLTVLSATGYAINNVLSYWSLHYTEALNALLIQSSGPLFVALWSLALFGLRLTRSQFFGIVVSLAGVITIILHGDLTALAGIRFNIGDIMYAGCMVSFGLYSALMPHRPKIHQLSLITCTTAGGAVLLTPFALVEAAAGRTLSLDALTVLTLAYMMIFPSALAYLFFNRGIALIGPNRAAPFQHLMPVFGSVLAILFLGEQPRLYHLVGYALVLVGVITASRQ